MATQAPPVTPKQYFEQLKKKIDWLEALADKATGLDERLDVSNLLLIETVKLLREGLKFQIPPAALSPLPAYNVRKFDLDTARTAPGEEIILPGDNITAFTDGSLVGCYIRIEAANSDAIPLNEFNPILYPAKFERFWLETTSQSGKYLRLYVGREAGAEALVQITAVAAKSVFYAVRSDKDNHFTGALATNAKEDENLSGLITNKIRIVGVALQSDQNLDYRVIFWKTDGFDDTDLDVDKFCGEVEVDLPTYGYQIAGAGQYYLDVRALDIDYEDEDASSELHVSVMNLDATAKNAGATGEVTVEIYYAPMA